MSACGALAPVARGLTREFHLQHGPVHPRPDAAHYSLGGVDAQPSVISVPARLEIGTHVQGSPIVENDDIACLDIEESTIVLVVVKRPCHHRRAPHRRQDLCHAPDFYQFARAAGRRRSGGAGFRVRRPAFRKRGKRSRRPPAVFSRSMKRSASALICARIHSISRIKFFVALSDPAGRLVKRDTRGDRLLPHLSYRDDGIRKRTGNSRHRIHWLAEVEHPIGF